METFVRDDSEDIYFGADPEPYLFEPEYTENELLERERKESVSEQKGGGEPIRTWCKCGACQPMPTERYTACDLCCIRRDGAILSRTAPEGDFSILGIKTAARVPDIKLQKPRPTSLAETKYTPPSRVKLPLHSSLIHLTFIRTGEKRENANQISGVHNALAVPEQKSDRLSNLTRRAADRRREQERESCHRDMQPHSRGHIHNVELSGPSTSQRSPLHHKFQHKPFCHQHAEFCRASEFYIKPRMQKGTGESPCKITDY
ncbi:hypothetical protein Q8A67_021255 [Cirrhinus molitorella]|uniref:Uncharacterized protein n=1 Tax=Cirrhinus molitorella TaxID=172907 RepID=A0AA88PB49_9TELE|nr:hypothetical protein Q8A67_021255 [Cirrhinus molitorella]